MSEFEVVESRLVDPPDVIVFVRGDVAGFSPPLINEVDVEFDALGAERSPKPWRGSVDSDTEFFGQFSGECISSRFAVLHVTTREIPHVRKVLPSGCAVTEQDAAMTKE
ncbi:MAG: hypothetical protein WD990_01230 [Acidimicrobiia bacterium]